MKEELDTLLPIYDEQITITDNPFTISCSITDNTHIIKASFTCTKNEQIQVRVSNDAKCRQPCSKKDIQKLQTTLSLIISENKDSKPVYHAVAYFNDSLKAQSQQQNKINANSSNEQEQQQNDDEYETKTGSIKGIAINPNQYGGDLTTFKHKWYAKDARVTKKYVLFWRDVFGQWFPSQFVVDGVLYGCCEQYMMAGKAKLFNDKESLQLIMKETDPKKLIKLGRCVKNFEQHKWDQHKEQIVYEGNINKFTQNKLLRDKLLSYDTKLCFVEASKFDRIWGIGLATTDPKSENRKNWKGTNLLGQIITRVRNDLRKQKL